MRVGRKIHNSMVITQEECASSLLRNERRSASFVLGGDLLKVADSRTIPLSSFLELEHLSK